MKGFRRRIHKNRLHAQRTTSAVEANAEGGTSTRSPFFAERKNSAVFLSIPDIKNEVSSCSNASVSPPVVSQPDRRTLMQAAFSFSIKGRANGIFTWFICLSLCVTGVFVKSARAHAKSRNALKNAMLFSAFLRDTRGATHNTFLYSHSSL
jgi:hypothetical protein